MFFISRLVEHNSWIAAFSEPARRHRGGGVEFKVPRRMHAPLGRQDNLSYVGTYLEKRRQPASKRSRL
jgi:hypothetical protein